MHRLAAVAALLLLPGLAPAKVELLGKASIPGTAADRSGLTDTLKDGTPHNRLGGIGSGIACTGQGNRYVLIADRGPKDGIVPFACRFHEFDIAMRPGAKPAVLPTLVSTTLMKLPSGKQLIGLSSAFDAKNSPDAPRFDPEGVRVGRTGTLFVADEYGPFVCEFDRQGKRLRVLDVPAKFLITKPGATPKEELGRNKSGRGPNRGLEGLAISPDGSKLYAILQSPLLQDRGDKQVPGKFTAVNLRILELPTGEGRPREFVYPMESGEHGVNEILAINDHEFLVLERDNKAGKDARFKKLFKIDIRGATDVSKIDRLPEKGLPDGAKPVAKKAFLDLLDPAFGLAGEQFPEKIEGLAFGPDLPDGRRLLLVTTDNDFKADEPTWFFAFAIDKADLPGYQPQVFDREKPK